MAAQAVLYHVLPLDHLLRGGAKDSRSLRAPGDPARGRQLLWLWLERAGDPYVSQCNSDDEEQESYHSGAAHWELVDVHQSGQLHPLLQDGHSVWHPLPCTVPRICHDLSATSLHGPRVHQVLQWQDHRWGAAAGQSCHMARWILRQLVLWLSVVCSHLCKPFSQLQLCWTPVWEDRHWSLWRDFKKVQG